MKKTALLAVALATCLGYAPARAADVVSSNIVGYSKLTMNANGYTMIANPFVEVGTGDLIGIADMFADDDTNAKSGTSASAADNIQVWNGEGYDTYYFRKPKNAKAIWVKGTTTETVDTLPEGGGAFYVNRASTNAVLTISGQVRDTTQTLKIVPGYNILENPFPTDLPISAFKVAGAKSGTSASAADNIQIWNGEGYDTYYYRKPKNEDPFWVKGTTTETTDTIKPYTSFFYMSRATEEGSYFEVTLESPIAAE